MIREPIYLITESTKPSSDPLDHSKNIVVTKVNDARVTELSGAQNQINVFGEMYDHSWVIRLTGTYKADKVGFIGEYNINDSNSPAYKVNQIRHHQHRTDIYISETKVFS